MMERIKAILCFLFVVFICTGCAGGGGGSKDVQTPPSIQNQGETPTDILTSEPTTNNPDENNTGNQPAPQNPDSQETTGPAKRILSVSPDGTKAFVIIPDQGPSSSLQSPVKSFFIKYLHIFKDAQAANGSKVQLFDLVNNKLLDTLVIVDDRISIDSDSCVSTTASMGANVHYYIVDNNKVLKQCVGQTGYDTLDLYNFSRPSITRLYTLDEQKSYYGKWHNRVFVFEKRPNNLTFIDLDNPTNPPTRILSIGGTITQFISPPGISTDGNVLAVNVNYNPGSEGHCYIWNEASNNYTLMPFSGGDLPERMTFINGGFGYLGSPLVDESSNKKTYLAQHESTLYKVNCETGGVTNLGSNLSHEGANTIVGISNNYALGSVYGGVASHIVSLVDGSVVSRSAKCPGCDPRATYSFFLLPKDYLLFRTENRLMMKKLTSANFTEMWETSASLVYEITDDRTHSFYVDRGFYINRDDGYVVLSDRINSAADGKLYLFPLTIDDFDLMPIGPADRTCTGAIGYAGSLSGRFVSFRCMDLGMPTEQNPRIYLYNINTSRTIDLSSIIGITEPIELWNVQILESSTTGPKVFIPVQEDYQRARAFLVDVTSETSREITF